MDLNDRDPSPVLAIIIPVWKQPGFLHDSVTSALAQQADFPIAVVIVNDGCPLAETDHMGRMLARAWPNVFYLRQPNRGLSGARNLGVAFALDRWPDLRAVFALDADNLLRPHAMAHALAALDQAREKRPEIGWIYPDIDMFDQPFNADYSGRYSVLLHTQSNLCEAGSLISRAVFDAGVRYDETLRHGWEDWAFWLSAVEAGFRGRHLMDFGFCYRRRAQSMLVQTATRQAHLYHGLMDRHPALYAPRNLLALQHLEAPRYARIMGQRVSVFTDPADPAEPVPMAEFARNIRAAQGHQTRYGLPDFILSVPEEELHDKTVYARLWRLERAALRNGAARDGQAVMVRFDLPVRKLPAVFSGLAQALVGFGGAARQPVWNWRVPALPWRLAMQAIVRRHLGGAVASARRPDDMPCVVISARQAGEPDQPLLAAIDRFVGDTPFHLVILGDPPADGDLTRRAVTVAHLPVEDPTGCAGFMAGMARVLVALPVADADLVAALQRAGVALWLYVSQSAQDAAQFSHAVDAMIASDGAICGALMGEGVAPGMIETLEGRS